MTSLVKIQLGTMISRCSFFEGLSASVCPLVCQNIFFVFTQQRYRMKSRLNSTYTESHRYMAALISSLDSRSQQCFYALRDRNVECKQDPFLDIQALVQQENVFMFYGMQFTTMPPPFLYNRSIYQVSGQNDKSHATLCHTQEQNPIIVTQAEDNYHLILR